MDYPILFFCDANYVSDLSIPVAKKLKAECPDILPVMIDISPLLTEEWVSGCEIFEREGFPVYKLYPADAKVELIRIVRKLKPWAIYIPHELSINAFAVGMAQRFGILSVQYQHGIYDKKHFEPEALPAKRKRSFKAQIIEILRLIRYPYRIRPSIIVKLIENTLPLGAGTNRMIRSDKMLVYGDYYKNFFQEIGVKSDKIEIFGNPYLSIHIKMGIRSKEELSKSYGLRPGAPLVIYFFSPYYEEDNVKEDAIEVLHDAIVATQKIMKDVDFLVLNHPRLSTRVLEPIVRHNFENIYIGYTKDNLYSLCQASTLIFGVRSGTLVDAMYAFKPIIIQSYAEKSPWTLITQYQAALSVTDKSMLEATINEILTNEKEQMALINNQEQAIKLIFNGRKNDSATLASGLLLKWLNDRKSMGYK